MNTLKLPYNIAEKALVIANFMSQLPKYEFSSLNYRSILEIYKL